MEVKLRFSREAARSSQKGRKEAESEMPVRIRLMRMGRRNRPFYRIVVADSKAPRDGKFVEILGHYDPLPDPPEIKVDVDRALYWLSVGAQPTHAAKCVLRRAGVLRRWHEIRFPPKREGEAERAAGAEGGAAEEERPSGVEEGGEEAPEREPASQAEAQGREESQSQGEGGE